MRANSILPHRRARGQTAADAGPLPELRLRRGAEHLHRLGARAVAELLAEVARAHGIEADTLDRLDRWRGLSAEACRAAGGDRFPPTLREVPR